jgi:hypothetical protein
VSFFQQAPIPTQDRSYLSNAFNSGDSIFEPKCELRPTATHQLHPPGPTQQVRPGERLHRLQKALKPGALPRRRKHHLQTVLLQQVRPKRSEPIHHQRARLMDLPQRNQRDPLLQSGLRYHQLSLRTTTLPKLARHIQDHRKDSPGRPSV